nr:MAG: hypothetical protein DIU74_01615 [Pseudomonadota bacterium]
MSGGVTTDMNRPLVAAFALSLALHLALLWWQPRWEGEAAVPVQPIVAELQAPAPAAPSSAPSAPAPPSEPRAEPRTQPRQSAPPARPRAEPKPQAVPQSPAESARSVVPAAEGETAAASPAGEDAPAPPEEAPDATARADGPAAETAPDTAVPAAAGAQAQAIDDYRAALQAAARKHRHYPRYARAREWEGRTTVRLEVDAAGRAANIAVAASSGYEVLDESALDMIRKAQREVALPAALQGSAFAVELTVLFALED